MKTQCLVFAVFALAAPLACAQKKKSPQWTDPATAEAEHNGFALQGEYTVNSIEGFAFSGCSSLASVAIPGSVTVIHREAFADCSSLSSVSLAAQPPDASFTRGQVHRLAEPMGIQGAQHDAKRLRERPGL